MVAALGRTARRAAEADGVRAGGALRPARPSGGTGVVTVLAHGDHPEWYSLPADPAASRGFRPLLEARPPAGPCALRRRRHDRGRVHPLHGYGRKQPRGPGRRRQARGSRVVNGAAANPALDPAVQVARDARRRGRRRRIVRHRLATRVVHWSTAFFFFVALGCGLPIYSPVSAGSRTCSGGSRSAAGFTRGPGSRSRRSPP